MSSASPPSTQASQAQETNPETTAGEIRQLLQKGDHKLAMWKAKRLLRESPGPASEAVMAEVYRSRIQDLFARGLHQEAQELALQARIRLDPSGVHSPSADANASSALGSGGLAEIWRARLESLAGPNPAESALKEVEAFLFTDPAALPLVAHTPLLPESHALRRDCAKVLKALDAVTCGPSLPADIEMPELSRKSPLAPYKFLARAIQAFYSGDRESCQTAASRIAKGSAASRLIPFFEAAGDPVGGSTLDPPRRALWSRIFGGTERLSAKLVELDRALGEGRLRVNAVLNHIRAAVKTCEEDRPELLTALRQRIAMAAFLRQIDHRRVRKASGAGSLRNAEFWRLFALANEDFRGQPPFATAVSACVRWWHYRAHALGEGLFKEGGTEEAAVLGRMARLLAAEDWPQIESMASHLRKTWREQLAQEYEGQPGPVLKNAPNGLDPLSWLDPEHLYRWLNQIEPSAENFQAWFDWIQKWRGERRECLERVGLLWRNAFPEDPRPSLLLMRRAEADGALSTARRHLEQAERTDGPNPEVRAARLRLLCAEAVRHLKQKKWHLALRDAQEWDALESAQRGRRPVFAQALRWRVACAGQGPAAAQKAQELKKSVAAGLGDDLSAEYFLNALCLESGCDAEWKARIMAFRGGVELSMLVAALSNAYRLCRDIHLKFRAGNGIYRELSHGSWEFLKELPVADLRDAAQAGLALGSYLLGYTASGEGMSRGGDGQGWFFLWRADSLQNRCFFRKARCLEAALTLGRNRGDQALISKALESKSRLQKEMPPWFESRFGAPAAGMDPGSISELAARELRRSITDLGAAEFEVPEMGQAGSAGLDGFLDGGAGDDGLEDDFEEGGALDSEVDPRGLLEVMERLLMEGVLGLPDSIPGRKGRRRPR